jgi:hypothetical protein
MFGSDINFPMISKALSFSMEVLTNELEPSELALQMLAEAQKDLHQALSFSAAENMK